MGDDPAADVGLPELPDDDRSTTRKVIGTVIRVLLVVAVLVGVGLLLNSVVDGFDWDEVVEALSSLSDAELLALGAMWLVWLACQGLQTAALVPGLPVRRGIQAYLGPAAVASVIPGPSDLPVRYGMLTSWGSSATEASLAVAAAGIFNIGIKLILPVVAASSLVISGVPLEGAWRTMVTIAAIVGVGVIVIAVAASRERYTVALGRFLDPIWRAGMRLLRKSTDGELAERLVAVRSEALDLLRDRWRIGTWGTVLAAGTRVALLVMCIRFTGVPEDAIGWTGLFVAYAFVQGLTAIPIMPGNAGVTELGYIAMITSVTGTAYVNQVTAGVLLFRILTWIVIIPAGLGALGLWRLQQRREAEREEEAEAEA